MGWGRGKGYGGIKATIDSVRLTYWGNRGLRNVRSMEGIEHRGFAAYARGAAADCTLPEGILSSDESPRPLGESPHPFRHVYGVTDPGMKSDAPFWGAVAAAFDAARSRFTPHTHAPQEEGEAQEEAA